MSDEAVEHGESNGVGFDIPEDVSGSLVEPRSEEVQFYPIELLPVEDVHPNPWNPNEMDEASFQRLIKEIREVGFVEPLQVVPYHDEDSGKTKYIILGGEHRHRAATLIGIPKIPCTILKHKKFSDVDFQKAMTVRLQVLRGRLNKDKMISLFREFADKYGADQVQNMFAFTKKDEWDKMVGETRKNLQKSGMPPEMLAEFDKNVKEARTVKDLGKVIQRLYELYKDTVPFGFMVFTWGKKEHVYVAMTKETKAAMDRVVSHAKASQTEINELLAPALTKLAEDLDASKRG